MEKSPTSATTTHQVQVLLGDLRRGSVAAKGQLLTLTQRRFRELAHRMLRRAGCAGFVEDTDDLLQRAMMGISRMLEDLQIDEAKAFFALASTRIRWSLVDMARSYRREQQLRVAVEKLPGGNDSEKMGGDGMERVADPSLEPETLEDYAAFHEAAGQLPEPENETFALVYHQGLTQEEVAELLHVSVRTVKYRWQSARLRLAEELRDGENTSD